MEERLSVVVSRGQGGHPSKRSLEENIVAGLVQAGVNVTVIPHVYDIPVDGPTHAVLRTISEDFILLSWLGPRAAHWTLGQFGVQGRLGKTLLMREDTDPGTSSERYANPRLIDEHTTANRVIYHMDLRSQDKPQRFLDEIKRIASEQATQAVDSTELDDATPRSTDAAADGVEEKVTRRWYPVIDYSRCTNCMECVDFCLFGVYGLDEKEAILVEQPDNCRKGCPACSRVCPENAIMFPQHKTPQIAGDETGTDERRIDLSQLFGAPNDAELARRERAEQVHSAASKTPGGETDAAPEKDPPEKDELDELIDELDQADL